MIRGSIASLGLTAPRAAGAQPPAPVNAVVTLHGWQGEDEQADEAVLSATVSTAPTSTLTLTLSNGLTITIEANETEGETEAFAVNPGASAYEVSVTDWEGGGYDNVDLTNAVAQVVPHPVHAVLTLADHEALQGATSATITATVSHPVYGTPLVITLDNEATITIQVDATSDVSTAFSIEPGGEPFDVAVESVSGGTYTSLDISDTCTVTPGQPVEMVRVYKGSIVKDASGSFPKSDLLAISGTTGALTEVECEAVGGGASGVGTTVTTPSSGGTPGKVAMETVLYADLPDTIQFTVGAGGTNATTSSQPGGATEINGIVTAAASGTAIASPKDRPIGPGQGGTIASEDPEVRRGGRSNASIPELMLEGGISASVSAIGNGLDATTPFQHGSGGAAASVNGQSSRGGWPGGGGGRGWAGGPYRGGLGGAGAARFHVYAWEPAA